MFSVERALYLLSILGGIQVQGLVFPLLVVRLCITISQFTGMNEAFQHLLVPVRLGSTHSHLTFAKARRVISLLSARELGKLSKHYAPSLEKMYGDQNQNHGMCFFRDEEWEFPGFSRVVQNFTIDSLLEKGLEKQTDQQDNSAVLPPVQRQ